MSDVQIDTGLPNVVSWTVDEPMERCSHALASGGRVWLVDPVADEDALAAAEKLGEPAAVLQLLDRHPRDCAEVATRYGVPHLELPDSVEGAPFKVHRIVWIRKWRELGLWWEDERILLVPEAVGTAGYFAVGRRAGIHNFLRLKPPAALRDFEPDHLLCGHGPPLHGDATSAIAEAVDKSRSEIPKAMLAGIRAFTPGRG